MYKSFNMARFLKLPKMNFFGKKMNFYIVGGLVLVLLLFSMGIFANKVQEGFQKKAAKQKKQAAQVQQKQEPQTKTSEPKTSEHARSASKKSQQTKNAEEREAKMKAKGDAREAREEREAKKTAKEDAREAREAKLLAAQDDADDTIGL